MVASGVRSLLDGVASKLGRTAKDVESFLQPLQDNWYDTVEAIAEATVDDLAALGIPRRMAAELVSSAPEWCRGGRGGGGGGGGKSSGKSSSKGKREETSDKGKGKSSKGKAPSGDFSITLPIDVGSVKPEFVGRVHGKVLGKKGCNVFHIEDQLGVRVDLTGKEVDGWLNMELTGEKASVKRAAAMCEDLIATVLEECGASPKKGKGKGDKGKGKREEKGKGKGEKGEKGKGKEKGKKKGGREAGEDEIEERIPVPTDDVDPDFYLRANLVGEHGKNVKHIEELSGVYVSVAHRDDDPSHKLEFVLIAKDESSMKDARELVEDLMSNVLAEAAEGPGEQPKKGKGGKKGKGKGKRKGKDDDDERPAKRSRTE